MATGAIIGAGGRGEGSMDGRERKAAEARSRVDALLGAFEQLTPDQLAAIGLRPAPDEERERLRSIVDEAAARLGRASLVGEARGRARETVLRRYADGMFHPTWAGLNWGISQGRAEDRAAVANALADAAACAVVEDGLDPEVRDALRLDADHVLALAPGWASEGSLARALAGPAGPDLRRSSAVRLAAGAAAAVAVILGVGSLVLAVESAALIALAGGGIVLVALLAARERPRAS